MLNASKQSEERPMDCNSVIPNMSSYVKKYIKYKKVVQLGKRVIQM